MNIQKCQQCYAGITTMVHPPYLKIYLSGVLTTYLDGEKQYLMECCYETYLAGSNNNNIIDYDERKHICESHKSKTFKIMIMNDKVYRMFEASVPKSLKTIVCNLRGFPGYSRDNPPRNSLSVIRQIMLNKSCESYQIYTNSEYKKHKTREQKMMQAQAAPIAAPTHSKEEVFQYVYMIQTLADINANQAVFKIGKTTQDNLKRFSQYDKGSKLYMQLKCHNCDDVERRMIELFRSKYIPRPDRGDEYFEGSYMDMLKDMFELAYPNTM